MKQRKQILVVLVLLLIAAAIWIYNSRQNPVSAGATMIASSYTPMNVDNLVLRTAKRDANRTAEYKGTGRNPFDATPPPPPPVAELPLKYYGYGTVPNGTARRAYLTDGDEIYVVAEGETLLGRYRILKIGNATLEFEDVTSHIQGRKNIEDAG